MPTESFNFINYSDQSLFIGDSSGKIQLRSYTDDLMLYSNFDTDFDATYAESESAADTTGTPSIENSGVFSQHISFTSVGDVTYSDKNFTALTDQGAVKLRVKPSFTKGFGHQDFTATSDPTIAGDTIYTFRLYVNDTLLSGDSIAISLVTGDSMGSVNIAVFAEINGTGAESEILTAGNIRIKSETAGDSILILSGTTNDLITLLTSVNDPELPNPPTARATLFDIYNGANNNNRVTLYHKEAGDSLTEGHLLLTMYSSSGDTQIADVDLGIWNISANTWYAFEFDWNKSIYQLFLDGSQFAVSSTGFTRTNTSEDFILQQVGAGDSYRYDELMVYNQYQNSADYTVETSALAQYSDADPYIDVFFGTGFVENEVRDLNLTCSAGCKFVVKIGATWYYYLTSDWVVSDATYSQSTTPANMESQFPSLTFNENAEVTIRVYFNSDGTSLQYIDNIEIVSLTGDSVPAIITGTVDLTDAVDISANFNFVITTDGGADTVDLRTGVGDSEATTMAELKAAINSYSIDGLDTVTDDGSNHLVLMSTSRGEDASVAVSAADTNDALSTIWGYAADDAGEEATTGAYVNYSELFRYVRSQLGEPVIPVELTDEQLEDCLAEAIYWYNYYGNTDENIVFTTLSGNNTDGYDIPATVGDPSLILEIILRPRFPFMYYAGREDLISNLYMQYIFQRFKSGYTTFLTDYYVTMTTEADLNVILGTQTKWEILNGKLYIFPDPSSNLSVGIKYASALSLSEINSNRFVKKFTLAEAKIVLGGIRSTFKSGIPMGADMAQLNGEDLIAAGNAEKEKEMEKLQKVQEPTFLTFF